MTVRTATASDIADAAGVLADAYEANPLISWFFPGEPARRKQCVGLFAGLLTPALRTRLAFVDGDGWGAAVWSPPIEPSGPPRIVRRTDGWNADRRATTLAAMATARPAVPHFYLAAVGVTPASRRWGLGSALLQPVLEQCDATGTPAYLENSDPVNQLFYEGLGFADVGPISTGPGGPLLMGMWRPGPIR
ncbi:MAG: N-acetyltransferase [Actinomycetia bacterium]|nr:N-acetyltransferase [Actinomycetes bacterium]